jgi:hypothetical protein
MISRSSGVTIIIGDLRLAPTGSISALAVT